MYQSAVCGLDAERRVSGALRPAAPTRSEADAVQSAGWRSPWSRSPTAPAKGCGCEECERPGSGPGHELERVLGERTAPSRCAEPACGVSDDELGEEAVAAVNAATDEQLISDTPILNEDEDTMLAKAAPAEPHAGSATIVCDGAGGYKVSLGSWAGAPCGTEGCVRKHEEQHIKDWEGRWPEGCKGKANGDKIPLGGDGYKDFLKKSECDAHTVDLACAADLLAKAKGDCKAKVQAYIKLTAKQKKKYC